MKTIEIDASGWTSIDDFYDALLPALKAPAWHSRSINAMIDSIIGGQMNGVEPPFVVIINGVDGLNDVVLDHLKAAQFYLAKARRETCASFDRDVDATIKLLS